MRPKIIITLIALLVGMVVAAVGQSTGPVKDYKVSELQQLKLKNLQLEAQLRQQELQSAQVRFQDSIKALMGEAGTVKKENGWPDAATFDPDKLVFGPPPPVEAKKESKP